MKKCLKQSAILVAGLVVLPAVLLYRLGCQLTAADRSFPFWSEFFSLLPGTTGVYLRRAFYRRVFPQVGEDVCVGFGTLFSHPTARLGRKVYVGSHCSIGDVTLEDDVLIGSHVSIINGGKQHGIDRLDVPIREQPGEWKSITIGEDSWIGNNAIVLANVGKHCVVGAGSVVTKPLPDYAIAVGNPARVVRFRTQGQRTLFP